MGRRSDDATAVDVAIYNPQRRRLSRSQTNFALEANPAAPGRGCSGGCPASIQTLSSTPRPGTPARPPTQHGRARERALSCRGMTECAPRSRPSRVARPRNVRPAAAPPPQPRPVGPPVQTTRPRARRVGARGTQQVSPFTQRALTFRVRMKREGRAHPVPCDLPCGRAGPNERPSSRAPWWHLCGCASGRRERRA